MTEQTNVSGERIKSFIERIERLTEEKQAITDEIKDVYAEARGTGFDTKAIREIVKLRKIDREKRQEQEEILNMYLSAIGME